MPILKLIIVLSFSFLSFINVLIAQNYEKPLNSDEIRNLLNNNQTKKAKHLLDSIKKQSDKYQSDSLCAEIYRLTSLYYRNKQELDSAIIYMNKAWKIIKKDNYDMSFMSYLPTLAYYYWEAGRYSNALEHILEAKRNLDKADSVDHSQVYNILGLTYLELRNFDKAKENFSNAIELAKKYDNQRYMGVIYANTGRLFFKEGNLEKALQYYHRGSNLEIKTEDYRAAGRSYADMGRIYLMLENYEKARNVLDTALQFNRNTDDKLGLSRTNVAMGKLSLKQKRYNQAEEYFLKAIDYAENKSAKKELMEGYYGLYEIYNALENYKKASQFLHKYSELYKNLYSVKKIIEVENLQHELHMQKEYNENQKDQIKKQKTINKLIIAVAILILVTAFILLFFLIRSRKNRKALRAKNREIQQQKAYLEQLNKKLKQAKETAENSEALKDHFLRNISHEIRTPLNGIVGFSAILAQDDISKQEKEKYKNIIERNAKTLLTTIDDIIDIAKIRTQQTKVFKKDFDINALLKELKKLFDLEIVSQKKNDVNILIEPDQDEPNIIYTDETKLRKVIMVLCNNALKFTQEGHIRFGYKTKNSHIHFFVEDTGIGISKNDQELIFESFMQVETSLNRNYYGIGVGLTIAKAFVEILDGKLWFESEKNKGTKFYFNIPLAR
ncbi:MAG: tetratricopeptide repeat protein [Bacteroidales bacterium]